jgi:hypothetical protein
MSVERATLPVDPEAAVNVEGDSDMRNRPLREYSAAQRVILVEGKAHAATLSCQEHRGQLAPLHNGNCFLEPD